MKNYIDLYLHIKNNLKIISSMAVLFSILFTSGSYFLPDKYISSSLLKISSDNENSLQSLAGNYQGLASVVGISLPKSDTENKLNLVIATLKSRDFLESFLEQNKQYAKNIYAAKNFNFKTNQLIYDENIFDIEADKWISNTDLRISPEGPRPYKVYQKFHEDIFTARVDPANNFIDLSIEHYSPKFAQDLLSKLIDSLNYKLREKDLNKATKSIEFLKQQINTTDNSEIKQSIFFLIQKNLETIMLSNTSEFYAIEPIDFPNFPEKRSFPSRKLFLVLGLFFGFFVGLSISFFRKR